MLNTPSMAGTLLAVTLLLALSATRVRAVSKVPGLATDCGMDLLGSRGFCTGICMGEHIIANLASLSGVGQCVIDAGASFNKSISAMKNPTYDDIYYKYIADRTEICGTLDKGMDCIHPLVTDACDGLGKAELAGMGDFFKSHLDCNNPKATTMISCLTSPNFINEIIKDFKTPSQFDHVCIKSVMEDPFVTGLTGVISTAEPKFEGPNPDIFGGMKLIIDYVQTEKSKLCSLVDTVTNCIKAELSRVAKDHCSQYNLDTFQAQVDGFKTVLLGCSNDNYYDLMSCGLDLPFWLKTTGLDGSQATCPLNQTAIAQQFGSIAGNIQAKISAGSPISIINAGFCEIVTFAECIENEMKKKCGQNLLWESVVAVTRPLVEWVDLKQDCSGRKRMKSMPTCKCHDASFPVGGTYNGQCSPTKRDQYRCGGYVLAKSEKGTSSRMQAGMWTAVITLLLMIVQQIEAV